MSVIRIALVLSALVALHSAERGKWLPISDSILAMLAAENAKVGYPGATAGVTVDRTTGAVSVVICDQGLWQSTDHGLTFARVDGKAIGGRCETGFAIDADPAGKRLMAFMIYGSSALTLDGGTTWSASRLSHLDFGAVDWSDPEARTMISVKHESGGEGVLSKDAGKTWTSLGKGFKAVGIFPNSVLMAERGNGIERSEDGMRWTKVAEQHPIGLAMRASLGVGYWTSDAGVLVSRDAGKTWSILGAPVKAWYGPYFGKDRHDLVVVGKDGISETTDDGATWTVVAPLPPEFTVGIVGPNFAWDPNANIFYASSMGKPAYAFHR
ncbi:MAG TPA: hypothetical protein VHX44_07470 [Planctomycetota bacterium]|nr:hypothetical protein [Planctomycetota bacterium]